MSPSVSRKASEPKIRPYLRLSIVEASRRRFPEFEGSDADFIEWVLSSINAGVMTFNGQPQAIQKSAPKDSLVETFEAHTEESLSEGSVNLLDEDAD